MKDKPEYAVDLDTGATLAAPIHQGYAADTAPLPATLKQVADNLAGLDLAPTLRSRLRRWPASAIRPRRPHERLPTLAAIRYDDIVNVKGGSGIMIRAKCHTADEVKSVEFDATPWFREVDADSILLLAKEGWSGHAVAEGLENHPGYSNLADVLCYARDRLTEETQEDPAWPTFECRIDASDALAWLEVNRPNVAQKVRASISAGP